MRYSNIEPLQDTSTGSPPAVVSSRPRANQCSCGSLSLGDRDETAQPRFRREQIVEAGCRAGARRRCIRSRAGGVSCRTGTRSWPSRIRTPAAPGAPARRCARLRLQLRRPRVPGAVGTASDSANGPGVRRSRGLRRAMVSSFAGLRGRRGIGARARRPSLSLRRQGRRSTQPRAPPTRLRWQPACCLICAQSRIVRLGGGLEERLAALRIAPASGSCVDVGEQAERIDQPFEYPCTGRFSGPAVRADPHAT